VLRAPSYGWQANLREKVTPTLVMSGRSADLSAVAASRRSNEPRRPM